MTLNYLEKFEGQIDLNTLSEIKNERKLWWDRSVNEPFKNALQDLPEISPSMLDLSLPEITIGQSSDISFEQREIVISKLNDLIPWRKGPFNFFGTEVDAEWRSDFKWERLKNSIEPLTGKRILDIGCNNGYFMFRMLDENPEMVMGIDPMILCAAQFEFINHFVKSPKLHFELFGIEHLPQFHNFFDTIFSMGIIYHHRHPIMQLLDIKEALVPGGEMILETIGIPGNESYALFPEDRYAKMRNVWFIPTLSCFINWVKKAKFSDIEVISESKLTTDEQRNTKWCPPPYQSLENFIHPNNPDLTIEGHPAPMRFCIKAKKRI